MHQHRRFLESRQMKSIRLPQYRQLPESAHQRSCSTFHNTTLSLSFLSGLTPPTLPLPEAIKRVVCKSGFLRCTLHDPVASSVAQLTLRFGSGTFFASLGTRRRPSPTWCPSRFRPRRCRGPSASAWPSAEETLLLAMRRWGTL